MHHPTGALVASRFKGGASSLSGKAGNSPISPKLQGMTLWITSKRGERDKVLLNATDEEVELRNLLSRSGLPYNLGWVEIDKGEGPGRRLIAYDHVAFVETSR
jgi:hypothetical protein